MKSDNVEDLAEQLEGVLCFCTTIADVNGLSIAIGLKDLASRDKSKWYSEDGKAFSSYEDRQAYLNQPGILERM